MPSISERAQRMPSSPIRRLAPYAHQAKKDGKTVHHLNIGQPDLPTPEVVREKLQQEIPKTVAYSDSAGELSYRERLTDYYKSYGIDLKPEELLITTGASEALLFTMKTCFEAGDELIVPEPFYANYNGFAIDSGIEIAPVTTRIEEGFELPAMEKLEERIGPKTKGFLLCNPSNPMGHLYSKEDILTLKELVKKHDLWLIADEVYREFCYDGAEPFSVMYLDEIADRTVLIDSVSKRYSLCGARVGALISKNEEVLGNALKFAQARLSPPTLGQIAADAALDTPDSYFEELRSEYSERRDTLVDGLTAISGILCPRPKGAFYAMARLPVDDAERFCQWLLSDFEWKGSTVMMAPAEGFYATEGMGRDEVRIAYVLDRKDLEEAIECLEQALASYPGRKVEAARNAAEE
ncbi:MAG: pyridoxal phosphate-dependent aminotransferase [Flavobacteriales bacterium]